MSSSTFYFKFPNDPQGNVNIWKIDHNSSRVLNWGMAEYIKDEDFKFD